MYIWIYRVERILNEHKRVGDELVNDSTDPGVGPPGPQLHLHPCQVLLQLLQVLNLLQLSVPLCLLLRSCLGGYRGFGLVPLFLQVRFGLLLWLLRVRFGLVPLFLRV